MTCFEGPKRRKVGEEEKVLEGGGRRGRGEGLARLEAGAGATSWKLSQEPQEGHRPKGLGVR